MKTGEPNTNRISSVLIGSANSSTVLIGSANTPRVLIGSANTPRVLIGSANTRRTCVPSDWILEHFHVTSCFNYDFVLLGE